MEESIAQINRYLALSGQVAIYMMIIPIIAGLLNWKKLDQALRTFFYYCLCFFLLNGLELLFLHAVEANPAFFDPFLQATGYTLIFSLIAYQLLSFLLLGYFFGLIFAPYGYQKGIWYLSIGLSILAIVAYITEQGWKNYGTFGPTSEAIFVVVLPLAYLWYLSRKTLGQSLLKSSTFLICLGLALPNLLSLIIFFTGDQLYEENFHLFAKLSILKNFFMLAGLLLFALGFWRARTTSFSVEAPDE